MHLVQCRGSIQQNRPVAEDQRGRKNIRGVVLYDQSVGSVNNLITGNKKLHIAHQSQQLGIRHQGKQQCHNDY